jgi:hypothetical protein
VGYFVPVVRFASREGVAFRRVWWGCVPVESSFAGPRSFPFWAGPSTRVGLVLVTTCQRHFACATQSDPLPRAYPSGSDRARFSSRVTD